MANLKHNSKFCNVAEVSFNAVFLLTLMLVLQLEMYYFLCHNNVIFFTKTLRLKKGGQHDTLLSKSYTNYLYFFIIILTFLINKSLYAPLSGLLFCSIIYLAVLSGVLEKSTNKGVSMNIIYLILPTFSFFVFFLFSVNSFLTLFFLIEVYSVLYYFCFLTSYKFSNQNILTYKSGLLFLLWNNFLTTFFLGLGCYFLLKSYGTTNFVELSLLNANTYGFYLYLVGLSWKLGLPLFHFFKLEVYNFLLKENVFLFSILTTLINVILLFFCLSQTVILNTLYLNNLCIFVIIFSVILVITSLQVTTILKFFALSSLFTITTVLSLFLCIKCIYIFSNIIFQWHNLRNNE